MKDKSLTQQYSDRHISVNTDGTGNCIMVQNTKSRRFLSLQRGESRKKHIVVKLPCAGASRRCKNNNFRQQPTNKNQGQPFILKTVVNVVFLITCNDI